MKTKTTKDTRAKRNALVQLAYLSGYKVSDLQEIFGMSKSNVYEALSRLTTPQTKEVPQCE